METKAQLLGVTQFPYTETDGNGNIVYLEWDDGKWYKWLYNDNRKISYSESSYGRWFKYKYDDKLNLTYFEINDGFKEYTIV